MAAANDPLPPTAPTAGTDAGSIQTAPSAAPDGVQAPAPAEPPIKLPPQPQPAYLLEEQAQGMARLDQAVVAVVLVLAFLLASFAVRNYDFWMHLAAGRDVLNGTYALGTDPYGQHPGATYWANHAWLFDVGLYELYQLVGGPALVVLKGLLVVALAWTLLQFRRPRQDWWLPAVCTGLALLAVGPRLLLQPTLLSFLFLAVTLWLLHRSAPDEDAAPGAAGPGAKAGFNLLWLLPPLFALWVNLDDWFVVGLLAVALYLVGELLQAALGDRLPAFAGAPAGAPAQRPRGVGQLALVLLVSVAACLVSPYGYHALTLPAEVSFGPATSLLARDSAFGAQFASPFSRLYWGDARLGANGEGLAFFPLALVGLASFAVAWPYWSWPRALVWLGFFALASWRWHTVPFFAVVGGPIAALNFADAAARRVRRPAAPAADADRSGARSWVAAVQTAAVLAVLLLALKWGTLTAFYTDKLAWPVLPVPFLVFAGFAVGVFAFGVVPTLAYFDRVFLNWSLGGRVLTLLAGVGLLAAAWPGWLGAARDEPEVARRVAWDVEPDPSLTQVARWLGSLREEGILQEADRGLALGLQEASYCAWFCPGGQREKSFFDQRFGLFPETAAPYLAFRDALEEAAGVGQPAPEGTGAQALEAPERPKEALRQLAEVFRENHLNHLVLHYNEPNKAPAQLLGHMGPLLADSRQWRLLYLDGRSAIFGWRDAGAQAGRPWAGEAYSTLRRAFGPDTPDRAPETAPPDPVAVSDFAFYVSGPAPRPLQADQAELHWLRFNVLANPQGLFQQESERALKTALVAGWVGSANPAPGPIPTANLLEFRTRVDGVVFPMRPPEVEQEGSPRAAQLASLERNLFLFGRDEGPPALPLLAVRAARQAIAASPQDPNAYLWLEAGYSALRTQTRERVWAEQLPALSVLRHVQMVTALQHALTVRPDQFEAEVELADLYGRFRGPQTNNQGYLDLRLKHLREAQKLLKRAGPQTRETEDHFKKRLEAFDEEVSGLQKFVKEQQNHYEVSAASKRVLEKARDALGRGLAEQALNVLWDSEVLEFGQQGAQLELELLLTTGEVAKARRLLDDPDTQEGLGDTALGTYTIVPAYPWYRLLLAGAEGDYRGADEQFVAMIKAQDAQLKMAKGGLLRQLLPQLFADLAETSAERPMAWQALVQVRRTLDLVRLPALTVFQKNKAELTVLRGLVALEAGDTARAETLFRQAVASGFPPGRYLPYLSLLGSGSPLETAALLLPSARGAAGPTFDFNGRTVAVRYLQLMDEAAGPRK